MLMHWAGSSQTTSPPQRKEDQSKAMDTHITNKAQHGGICKVNLEFAKGMSAVDSQHTCVHACTHAHTHARMHARTHAHLHTHTNIIYCTKDRGWGQNVFMVTLSPHAWKRLRKNAYEQMGKIPTETNPDPEQQMNRNPSPGQRSASTLPHLLSHTTATPHPRMEIREVEFHGSHTAMQIIRQDSWSRSPLGVGQGTGISHMLSTCGGGLAQRSGFNHEGPPTTGRPTSLDGVHCQLKYRGWSLPRSPTHLLKPIPHWGFLGLPMGGASFIPCLLSETTLSMKHLHC